MKNSFCVTTLLACLGWLSYTAIAAEPERTEFEKQVIGRKWKNAILSFNIHPLAGQCTALSSQMMQQDKDLGLYNYLCSDGRVVSVIAEWLDPERTTSKALDAFLFPLPKEGEKLMFTGDCSLNGDTLTDFTALVRMGDHESVDWQTGVIAAWLPNVITKKYEPLSTRHVVCDVPTPP